MTSVTGDLQPGGNRPVGPSPDRPVAPEMADPHDAHDAPWRRADVEGLRALAVGLVIAGHLNLPRLWGGAVGVDVFFVISGFVITSALVRELETTGGVSWPRFVAARVRRLLPLATMVIVATVVGIVVWEPQLAPSFVGDAVSSALFWFNNHAASHQLVYGSVASSSPFAHYWSLGVEEQFYVLWPMVVLVAARGRRDTGRGSTRRLGVTIAVIGTASFATAVVLARSNPLVAFYLLPTRAWELMCGALLAAVAPAIPPLGHRTRNALGLVGLAAIALAAHEWINPVTVPGFRALVPVLGAVVVIAAGVGGGRGRDAAAVQRLLGWRPAVEIGRVSYAAYLWHWPFILLFVPSGAFTTANRLTVVAVTAIAAVVTTWVVERPIRHSARLVRSPRATYLVGATLTVVAVLAGVTMTADATDEPDSQIPHDLIPSLARAGDDGPQYHSCRPGTDWSAWPRDLQQPCVMGDLAARRTIALFGDSHVAQWFTAFDRWGRAHHVRIAALFETGCPWERIPFVMNRPGVDCQPWRDRSLRQIRELRPSTIVLGGYAAIQIDAVGADAWIAGGEATASELPAGIPRVVLGDAPTAPSLVPACLAQHDTHIAACAIPRPPADAERLPRRLAELIGARYVAVSGWVCPRYPCPVIRGRYLVYRDAHHLAFQFAATLRERLGREVTRR